MGLLTVDLEKSHVALDGSQLWVEGSLLSVCPWLFLRVLNSASVAIFSRYFCKMASTYFFVLCCLFPCGIILWQSVPGLMSKCLVCPRDGCQIPDPCSALGSNASDTSLKIVFLKLYLCELLFTCGLFEWECLPEAPSIWILGLNWWHHFESLSLGWALRGPPPAPRLSQSDLFQLPPAMPCIHNRFLSLWNFEPK